MATLLGSKSPAVRAADLNRACPSATDDGRDTPSQVLAAELLILALSLATPRSVLATASSATLSICTNARLVRFGWRNTILLGDLSSRPAAHAAPGQEGNKLPVPIQRSNVENVLKSLLPSAHDIPASGIAPTSPAMSEPFLTPDYLLHLYKHTFFRPSATASLAAANQLPSITADILSLADGVLRPLPLAYNWWRPITDAFLLPVYLIRAGQLDLLDACLAAMTECAFNPSMPYLGMGMVSWSAIFLDNRQGTTDMFFEYVRGWRTDRTTAYPLVLATVALLEWSLPALKIVLVRFPALSPSDVAQLADASVLSTMYQLLTLPSSVLPDNVDRIIDVYKWLASAGAQRLHYPLTSVLVHWAPCKDYVMRALVEIDIPYMKVAEQLHTQEAVRAGIIRAVKKRFPSYGDKEVLSILVAHGIMEVEDWARHVMWSVDRSWARVAEFVSEEEEQKSIAMTALNYALDAAGSRESLMSTHPQARRHLAERIRCRLAGHIAQQRAQARLPPSQYLTHHSAQYC
ncbi:hypothetical protein BCR44DRAFT_62403 [Catenaria anguillulae PL171]|uniref:Uncharacterized protein n=1 Tax=Catenaria anguillulae PL171 TaxID=765915 RepID=A0A1Y2H7G5_9FUNG|nr:hypothetical protein BCR44DRAFT_62403 [Catenaria anguillulae PL171]